MVWISDGAHPSAPRPPPSALQLRLSPPPGPPPPSSASAPLGAGTRSARPPAGETVGQRKHQRAHDRTGVHLEEEAKAHDEVGGRQEVLLS